jgi:hypothetical protein
VYFNRIYFLILLSFLILGVTIYNFSLVKKEYSLVNTYGGGAASFNLLSLHANNFIERIKKNFDTGNEFGLPIVDLYIPEKSDSILNKDLPLNIKKWVPGYLKYPNGKYKEISYRYRGDAFVNWAYQTKAYKIKLKKKNLIDSKRVFNYSLPSTENTLSKYLSYHLGKSINLPTPDARFVEMRINGDKNSIFIELEHLNEGFLRRNNFMPVNLYKGEQIYTERDTDKGIELFNNPSLWSKVAIFNQRKDEDHADLGALISLIRSSEASVEDISKLDDLLDLDSWAKFDALQTLLQSDHNDDDHNMRVISDIWKGEFLPVVYEVSTNLDQSEEIIFEIPTHSLFKILHKSSNFLSLKYKYLYDYLNEGILTKSIDHLEDVKQQLKISWPRDVNKQQIYLTNRWNSEYYLSSMVSKWDKFTDDLVSRESSMINILNQSPESSWNLKNSILSLSIKGVTPLVDPVFIVNKRQGDITPNLYFDSDNNGTISKDDLQIPVSMKGNRMHIEATFFANRGLFKAAYDDFSTTRISNTVFNLISDQDLSILRGYSNQYFNQERKVIKKSKVLGQTPHRLNVPIFKKNIEREIWSGTINVYETKIITRPIRILPGTNILMHNGASLIFKNHVSAIGLPESLIRFSAVEDEIWGTVALVGPETNNSKFEYMSISGGSGYELPNIKFTGMISVHNTKDISFINIDFSRNFIFDDLVHVVYSQNLLLKNCKITDALFDAIDIDISDVIIENCKINNSGNDGIDSMSSLVKIKNSSIKGSLDKGISVGERSKVFVTGTDIYQNKIGIESKDISSVVIYKSSFLNNKKDLNAYKKNWQYGGGGTIKLLDDSLAVDKENVSLDKHSLLYLYSFSENFSNYEDDRVIPFDIDNRYFKEYSLQNTLNFWGEVY